MSDSIFQQLEVSFENRIADPSLFKNTWDAFTAVYPPTHCLLDFNELPSTAAARESGDLGFAVLWIVQSVLIRCIHFDVNQIQPWSIPLKDNTIGAMAHSEYDELKMTVSFADDESIILSGSKRYISGGTSADLILVTARKEYEDKFTHIISIPANTLPHNALNDITLSLLPTIKHARLLLEEFKCSSSQSSPVNGKALRKILKKWSLIERALIGEAYIGFLCYLTRNIPVKDQNELISEAEYLLSVQKSFSRQQLENAFSDKHVDILGDVARVLNITQRLAQYAMEHPEKLNGSAIMRFKDLHLFNKMRL